MPRERVERNRTPHVREGRKRLELFPGNGYGESVVVRSERDCAREDQLILFIPNDRLEAARFDGLTLMLRDTTFDPSINQTTVYDERPLYIPPNYIEGFQIAKRQG